MKFHLFRTRNIRLLPTENLPFSLILLKMCELEMPLLSRRFGCVVGAILFAAFARVPARDSISRTREEPHTHDASPYA